MVSLLLFYGIGTLFITKREHKFKAMIYFDSFLLLGYIIDYFIRIPVSGRIVGYYWYLTFPIIGAVIYYYHCRMLNIKETMILFLFNYLICIYGVMHFAKHYYYNEPYLISSFYAIVLFCTALYFKEYWKENRFLVKISELSYSVYLIHMTYGSLILSVIEQDISYTIIFFLVCGLVIMIAVMHEYLFKVILGIERRRRSIAASAKDFK